MYKSVGEQKDVVLDARLDQEPVMVDEGVGDELPGLGACEDPGSEDNDRTIDDKCFRPGFNLSALLLWQACI